jgi:hypothetical protein
VKVGDAEYDTAWLVDTMVLEQYRSQAVGAQLMAHAHEDTPFALSLGQTKQMREIQLRLGWAHVAPLETAQLLLRPERVLRGKLPAGIGTAAGFGLRAVTAVRGALRPRAGMEVRRIDSFGAAHDQLWKRMANTARCAVRRDASYLNWKYVAQPGQDFVRLEVHDHEQLRGVAVLMFRDPDDAYHYRRGFLVDVVAPLNDAVALDGLVRAAIETSAQERADAISCLHIGPSLTQALTAAGFRLREPERHLLVRPGGLDDATSARVLEPNGWFVTQGDSDIDRPW